MKKDSLSIFHYKIFTLEEVWNLFRNESLQSCKVQLSRLCKKGTLVRLKRNCYTFHLFHPDLFLIGQSIISPSYYSLETVLSSEGIIPEGQLIYTLITSKKTRAFKTPFGIYSYRHLKPELFFGIEKRPDGTLFASKEKALLDYLYLNSALLEAKLTCFQEERFDQLEFLDWKKMTAWAPRYRQKKLIRLVNALRQYASSDAYQAHR